MHAFRLRPGAAFALAIAVAIAALTAPRAHAQSQSVSLGVARVTIHSQSPDISGPLIPAGANLHVDSATTLFFGYTHDLPMNFQFDFAGGIPPKHNTEGRGLLGPAGTISTFKQFAPTFFINYKFGGPEAMFQPYIGLGLNYTHFYDGVSTPSGNAANGGPTSLKLKDSYGLAGHIGLVYNITPAWFVNGSVTKAHVSSDLTADTAGLIRYTNINFRPVVFILAGGMRF